MRPGLAIALFAIFCFSVAARAETLQVRVVEVQDGKTLVAENTGRRIKIVLKGAEAPELDQPVGDVARQHLADLILGKQVSVEFTGMAYGDHFVARLFSEDRDISLQMIRDGVAWFDRAYENDMSEEERRLYAESEQAARNERRGIWQEAQPTPPWEWRRARSQPQRSLPEKSLPAYAPGVGKKPLAVRRARRGQALYSGYSDAAGGDR
jgi:endonuclease YncB( thermonuclease family)